VPFLQPDELISSVRHFNALFADAGCYIAAIPTYVGGHMAIGWAADDVALRQTAVETLAARYKAAGLFATRYWTPEVHKAAFALPRFIAEHVETAKRAK
jgi:spermidine synthase